MTAYRSGGTNDADPRPISAERTDSLAHLERLAQAATPRTGRLNCIREDCFCPECALQIAVPAERVLAMIAVVKAAKAMREDMSPKTVAAFDAALAELEGMK